MTSTFGAAVKTWRGRLSVADTGLPATARRRAAGLRREELASLAGLSVDYVVRLEQGRARHPSPQVVAALARALQLNDAERDHLYRTAGLLPPAAGDVGTHIPPGVARVAARHARRDVRRPAGRSRRRPARHRRRPPGRRPGDTGLRRVPRRPASISQLRHDLARTPEVISPTADDRNPESVSV